MGRPKRGELFIIEVDIINKKVFEELQKLGDEFEDELNKTFKRLIFDVNKYLIRVTPIDTGELRGGWTAFLDSEQEDYSKQIFDTSLAIKALGRDFKISPSGVAKGKDFSKFEFPTPLNFTIINSVPYGFFLEHGTSKLRARNFVAITRYKAENRFTTVFTKWFNDIGEAQKIVPVTLPLGQEEITP